MTRLLILLFISLTASQASAYEKMDAEAVKATLSIFKEDLNKIIKQEGNVYALGEKRRFNLYSTALNNLSGETSYDLVIGAQEEPSLTDAYTQPIVFKIGCMWALGDYETNKSQLKAQMINDRVYTLCSYVDLVNPTYEKYKKIYLDQIRGTISDQVRRKAKRVHQYYRNSHEFYKDYPSVKAMTELLKYKAIY
ncbi:hypothetical protein DX883_02770 [Vibrio fluvialis]|nr:hypothetical protein [Vibrio fluvialis]EKO3994680.1 hypothetical protein [Vibrio fluvialis]